MYFFIDSSQLDCLVHYFNTITNIVKFESTVSEFFYFVSHPCPSRVPCLPFFSLWNLVCFNFSTDFYHTFLYYLLCAMSGIELRALCTRGNLSTTEIYLLPLVVLGFFLTMFFFGGGGLTL